MGWWHQNTLRMIQNNLRDIDAGMDIGQYVKTLQWFGANACMVGCGGISAFYPTDLWFHHRNPYLRSDFFGELITACHAAGIRVIARFDFSKTHESIYAQQPQWYSRSIQGGVVRYHDTVATCVNGGYQQDCTLQILGEVLGRYPVDGVFFNMFGYQTRDYSGNYVGICQCDSCRSRFLAETGLPLPTEENAGDPVFQRYRRFKQDTVDQLLTKISGTVHSLSPDTAVCTYSLQGVDMVRNESNSAIDRPPPFWLYNSEYNVSVVEGSFEDKVSSNCVINAVDIFCRFMGVSSHLNQIRLYGDMAAGGGLDWCIIGDFQDYPDRENFESVRQVFRLHKRHEGIYGNLSSQARVLLVTEHPFGLHGGGHEAAGLYKMLKESHILFDLVAYGQLDAVAPRLSQYEWVLLPSTKRLEPGAFLDAVSAGEVKVLATGMALADQPQLLRGLFGVTLGEALSPSRGAYLCTADKRHFPSLPQKDWVYLDMEYRYMRLEEGAEGLLPLVAPARYGPPERCFGHEVTDQPSAAHHGRFLYLPWMPGSLYYSQGFEAFKHVVLDLLRGRGMPPPPFETNAPTQVEVFFDRCGPHEYLLQLLNLTGFNGTTVFAPIPVPDVRVALPGLAVQSVQRLTEEGLEEVPYTREIHLARLGQYEAFLVNVE